MSRIIDENLRKIFEEYAKIEKILDDKIVEVEDIEKLEKYLSARFNEKMQELEKEKAIVCSLWEVLGEEKSEELEKVSLKIYEDRK